MKYREKFYDWQIVDHDKEFTMEDFFNFNESFGTIKFNPLHKMEVRKAAQIDIYLKDNEGYQFYEITNSSIIRPFSTRMLYNKENGLMKNLIGSNAPIYETNEQIKLFDDLSLMPDENAPAEDNQQKLDQFKKYIRLFFDHVAGKNGFFYICESAEEIKEAINLYYSQDENKEEKERHKTRLKTLTAENKMGKFRTLLEKNLSMPSKNKKFQMSFLKDFNRDEYLCSINAFMIFKNALFQATVNISKTDDGRQISLSNEEIGIRDHSVFDNGARKEFEALGYEDELPPFDLIGN